jgi:Protein of unknown function (DUF2459)
MRLCLLLLTLLTACATTPPPVVPHGPIQLAIAQRGWHTEIGIPNTALTGPLASLGPATLHRHYLLVGFGARAYFTNPKAGPGTAAEALLPGPSAIDLASMDNLSADKITWLYVSQDDINHMLAFIWQSIPNPAPIVTINNANIFYASQPGYNMLYNCNNWAVDVLRAGNLPFTNSGLHYASDVQAQAKRIAAAQTQN